MKHPKSFHVLAQDNDGYFTEEIYDPLLAVIARIKERLTELWYSDNPDRKEIDNLNDAVRVCIKAFNTSYISASYR